MKSVAFIVLNSPDPLSQRDDGVAAANELGIEVLSSEDTYEPGTTDFVPVVSKVVGQELDLIVLSGVTPADVPLLIRTARELGYQGILSTEATHDINILNEVPACRADGTQASQGLLMRSASQARQYSTPWAEASPSW